MESWLFSVLPFLLWTCCTSQNVCLEPPDIDFGEMISDEKARYLEGDRTQYKCNPGYVLEGTEWITCHGQKWTPAPRCLAPCGITKQQLDAQDLLLPGKRRRSQAIQHNQFLQFLCKEGHVITAPSVRKCIDGHMDLPLCISEMGKNCSHPPTIENGDIITLSQKQYASGSSVEFKCQKYYAMEGENRTFCNNGNWTKVPICLEPCAISLAEMESKKVQVVGQSDEHRFQNLYVQRGTSVELACKPGHAPAANYSPSAFVIRCNGEAIVYPECEEITCNPPKVAHGTFRPRRNIYHGEDLIQIQCDSGFHLADGQNIAECTRNGWSPLPRCSNAAGKCGPPPPIENGDFLGTATSEYMPGAQVQYKCQAFHNMQGNQYVQCVNGHWTDTPTCIAPCIGTEEDMNQNNIRLKWGYSAKLYTVSGDKTEFACKWGFRPDPTSPPFRALCREGKLDYPRCIPLR
ncbi:Hypothetical predicted protein [Podarcis lilfordi]|uniref:Sushi domain-containing protein n=1 Tax=Podarcis lilfordi TaxID=74358 RepID=A0AA35P9G2_9SAUR|nr:Hypothetical predicted protein [Podarcis lilfordi]